MTWLGWVGVLGLTAGLALGTGAVRRRGVVAKLRRLAVGLVCLSLGALCLGLWMALRSCEAFSRTTLVAEVRCRWVGPQAFTLTLTPWRSGRPQAGLTVTLRGDQWTLSGGIVKWHPWLTALGIPSYHTLTRISGRFA